MITVMARRMYPPRSILLCIVLLANLAAVVAAPKVKIRTQADKTFSFKNLRTWDWHADGAGEVKLMTTAIDAEQSKQWHATLDPIITAAVEKELSARGFERKPGGADFIVNYYVLTVPGTASNEMGQFLPSVAEYRPAADSTRDDHAPRLRARLAGAGCDLSGEEERRVARHRGDGSRPRAVRRRQEGAD